MSKLLFVRIGDMLIVGREVDEAPKEVIVDNQLLMGITSGIKLKRPLLVFGGENPQSIAVSPLVGNPDVIEIPGVCSFMYENQDSNFEKFYSEQVSGLSLVK